MTDDIKPLTCPVCGKPLRCDRCKHAIGYLTHFDQWISDYYKKNGIPVNIQDIDKVIYNKSQGWYITLELKTRKSERSRRQIELQDMLTRILKRGSIPKEIYPNPYDPEYRGHYIIHVDGSDPNDSAKIEINGNEVGMDDLEYLLRYGRLPDW